MSRSDNKKRVIRVYRYDPMKGGEGHFDRFELDVEDETNTTILDVLLRIQREFDPSISFRYACRVNMCGSCGMVINGKEGLACKTNVSDIPKNKEITLRSLNHFPIIKDLVVDLQPFFERWETALCYFDPKAEASDPAVIRPDSKERRAIGLATECIACGCCVSSCTMVNHHGSYAGPAALNRAFTLLMDSRDGLYEQRMDQILQSCYHCRTEFNCTEVCPKEISSTRAIKCIQRLALKALTSATRGEWSPPGKPGAPLPSPFDSLRSLRATPRICGGIPSELPPRRVRGARGEGSPDLDRLKGPLPEKADETAEDMARRAFLKRITYGLGAASALVIGYTLASAFIGTSMRQAPKKWVRLEKLENLALDRVTTVHMPYEVQDGFYEQQVVKPVMVWRRPNVDDLVVYNTTCTHLGCTVHWDEGKNLFLCACHGGMFDINGDVKAGPPPRPLDRHGFRVEDGYMFVEVA